ncbi:ARM repeat-containing protein [Hymenopellis radicata]|nr:ARM repeat-containing protein [Hymenopellis radicata]
MSVVPPEISAELAQILSNLVLGDNAIRASAEKTVNERLAHTPELYLLALAQFAVGDGTEGVMRSFSLVLLRRLLFRSSPVPVNVNLATQRRQTLTIESLLLHSLAHEPSPPSMARGRMWHALQQRVFELAANDNAQDREIAYGVFNLHSEIVVRTLTAGLESEGEQLGGVRLGALNASVAYLDSLGAEEVARVGGALMGAVLGTLERARGEEELRKVIEALHPLCATHPVLFAPHLPALVRFLQGVVLPPADCESFVFPPPPGGSGGGDEAGEGEGEERKELRLAALEMMVSLSESKPGMVRNGMGEWEDDVDSTVAWLREDSLDRVACALGGNSVLPPAFQYIPSMLVNYDWRARHAGLMAIAAVAEGTGRTMQNELGKIVEMVTPMFADTHPRVRWASCQCVGQLCTDLADVLEPQHYAALLSVLIPTLEDPEARVHSHAAAALINFCEGVERDVLAPYVDAVVERLVRLMMGQGAGGGAKFVQEQAITTLAMVADASERGFVKHYPTLMPLLLNVLRNPEVNSTMRNKAMECAGLVAIAVGTDVFRPDAQTLVEVLVGISKTPSDPNDTQLAHYLMGTWAKVCQALGPEFAPYVPVVMPGLLQMASKKADVSVFDAPSDSTASLPPGWDLIPSPTSDDSDQVISVRTQSLEEKCQALETLLIIFSTLPSSSASSAPAPLALQPYISAALSVALSGLKFTFHDGVREASAMLAEVEEVFKSLIQAVEGESDAGFVASLFKSMGDCLRVCQGTGVDAPVREAIVGAVKRQVGWFAERRRSRSGRVGAEDGDEDEEDEDLLLIEEMEDFALEDMGKVVELLFPEGERDRESLLIGISSVRDLGRAASR